MGKNSMTPRLMAAFAPLLVVGATIGPLPAANLIGHWEFDASFAATVGTNATGVGGAGFTADRFGTPNSALAAVNTGASSGQYASVAGGGGLNNLQSGTIAFWVRWLGTQDVGFGNMYGGVTSRQDNGFTSEQLIGLSGSDPATAVIIWRPYTAPATGTAITGGTAVGDGDWHHVAITYSSGSHILYLDGNVDGTGNIAGTITNKPGVPLGIGAWYGDGNSYPDAEIDDFRVYDDVLTQDEIRAIIPEPSAGALLSLALLAAIRRRR